MNDPQKPCEPQLQTLDAFITGRVHGVGYRVFVLDAARQLHLGGWVRNTPEGGVEVHAVGERPGLDDLLVRLRKGPPAASVRDVEYTWSGAPSEGKPSRFEVRN